MLSSRSPGELLVSKQFYTSSCLLLQLASGWFQRPEPEPLSPLNFPRYRSFFAPFPPCVSCISFRHCLFSETTRTKQISTFPPIFKEFCLINVETFTRRFCFDRHRKEACVFNFLHSRRRNVSGHSSASINDNLDPGGNKIYGRRTEPVETRWKPEIAVLLLPASNYSFSTRRR